MFQSQRQDVHALAVKKKLMVQPTVEMIEPETRIEATDIVERSDAQQRGGVECARFLLGHACKVCRNGHGTTDPDIGRRQQALAFRQMGNDDSNFRISSGGFQTRHYGREKVIRKRRVLGQRQQPFAILCSIRTAVAQTAPTTEAPLPKTTDITLSYT